MPRTTVESAIAAADRPRLLQSAADLKAAQQAWSARSVLGIDTEFLRERTYRADLGLVQVSDGATAWLWDPQSFKSAAPIQQLLSDERILKVLHSGSEDLEVLLHALDVIPQPLCDTQIACALLGQPLQLSYQDAVKWLLDIAIEKDHTRSNWIRRPLRPGQLRYAAMDVVLLPQMLETLRPRLEAAGRWTWLEEEVDRMRKAAAEPVDPDRAYVRVRGANRLDDDGLRALQVLARWREETAQARNLARGFVVSDAGLLALARLRPASPSDLLVVDNLHPRALKRYQGDLLQMVATAASDRSPIYRPEPLNNGQRRALKDMQRAVKARARELDVDPALLASRRELERLLRAVAAGKPPPERFRGWRQTVITDELLGLIG